MAKVILTESYISRNRVFERNSIKGACLIAGCDNKIHARLLCNAHYRKDIRLRNMKPCFCGCGELTAYRFISGHKTRLLTPEEQSRRASFQTGDAFRGTGTRDSYVKRKGRHEHRLVMENILGRRLTSDEIVHHKDHDKKNNHPDNLQLMTRSEHIAEHRDYLVLKLREYNAAKTKTS